MEIIKLKIADLILITTILLTIVFIVFGIFGN